MKRAKKAATDIACFERPPIATREQYELFYEYQKYRHLDSDMAEMNFNEYRSMIEDTPVDTCVYEFRDMNSTLVAASLTDKVKDGLSGIYKFFTPNYIWSFPSETLATIYIYNLSSNCITFYIISY